MKWYLFLILIILCSCTKVNTLETDSSTCSLETVASFEPHDQVNFLTLIDNQLAYTTIDNQTCTGEYRNTVCTSDSKVYLNNEVIAELNKSVNILWDLNNKVAYKTMTGEHVLYINKDKIAAYNYIQDVREIDNKLVFIASKDLQCGHRDCSGTYVIVNDGVETPVDVRGLMFAKSSTLAYSTSAGNESYMIYKDKKYGPYRYVEWPVEIDNQIVFSDENKIYIDGVPLDTDYDRINYLASVNGRLVYTASKGDQSYLIDGNQTSGPYEWTDRFVPIGGKIAVIERVDGMYYYIYFDNNKFGPYNSRPLIYDFNNELAYLVRQEENYRPLGYYTLYYKGCEIKIENIKNPVYYNGNIAYTTKENNKEFVVIKKLL